MPQHSDAVKAILGSGTVPPRPEERYEFTVDFQFQHTVTVVAPESVDDETLFQLARDKFAAEITSGVVGLPTKVADFEIDDDVCQQDLVNDEELDAWDELYSDTHDTDGTPFE